MRKRLAKLNINKDMDLWELLYTVDGSENLPAGKILKNILDKLNIWIHPIEIFVSVHQNI